VEKEGRVIKPKKKLMALSINEELGDVATHFMKSGSSFRPKKDLEVLNKFKHRLIPDSYRELPFEYDVMFNTNEVKTIRAWLYTDFLGKGIYVKVNSVKINDKLFKDIVNSDIKIDEERIEKIIANLQNKYSLQWNTEFHEKVIFPPGSNLMRGPLINFNKVKKLVKEQGFKLKPHPITAPLWIAKWNMEIGEENVLHKKEGGYELLLNCNEVAVCPNSEMGIIALLLKKKLQLVSNPRQIREKAIVTYESFYDACSNTKHCTAYEAICKILSSKRSGIIFDFDNDAEERLQRYLDNFWEYTIKKRY
tara:strand:- start:449 stop:1369 length:921 start_codon:yes stop_codon:yes gene_type:complete